MSCTSSIQDLLHRVRGAAGEPGSDGAAGGERPPVAVFPLHAVHGGHARPLEAACGLAGQGVVLVSWRRLAGQDVVLVSWRRLTGQGVVPLHHYSPGLSIIRVI